MSKDAAQAQAQSNLVDFEKKLTKFILEEVLSHERTNVLLETMPHRYHAAKQVGNYVFIAIFLLFPELVLVWVY